jgi:hypothetical protein
MRTFLLFCLFQTGILLHSAHGRLLHTFELPSEATMRFGSPIASVGDANSDGYSDVAISGNAPHQVGQSSEYVGGIYIFSGKTGCFMYTLSPPYKTYDWDFGCAVAGVGDVNQDGFDDVIVGAMRETRPEDLPLPGRAYIFGGLTGSLLYTLMPPDSTSRGHFGCSVAGLGDVDNDGWPDVVVGAYDEISDDGAGAAGRAYVMSGADGTAIHTLMSPNEEEFGAFGYLVEGIGDANSDRYPDVLVGAPGEGPNGRAYVFSGIDGSVVRTFSSLSKKFDPWFGMSLADAGDVNRDGVSDMIVGAYRGDGDAGRAYVYGGADGSLLHDLVSPQEQSGGHFGRSAAGIGDLNNDGYGDVVIGASGESGDTGSVRMGRVYVFSGRDGSILRVLTSQENESRAEFGQTIVRAGDINGDGYDDLLIAAREKVYAFSGALSPVELAFFEAEVTGNRVVIRWRTNREYDCHGFQVFRQMYGETERLLITDATIPGGGDWTEHRDYQYADDVNEAGEYQYWLGVTATDGRSMEYGPIDVDVYPIKLALGGPYPNPVSDDARLMLLIPETATGDVAITLHDLAGRQLGGSLAQNSRYTDEMRWSASQFGVTAGVYVWRLRVGGDVAFKTMVVMR